jgi:hypothetical protein
MVMSNTYLEKEYLVWSWAGLKDTVKRGVGDKDCTGQA